VSTPLACTRRVIAAATLIALAACSGGGGSHSVVPSATGGTAASGGGGVVAPSSTKTVTAMNQAVAFSSSAKAIGPATTINSVVLHVVPALQNAAGLAAYAQQASDPTSANYRRFLTPAQIATRYGATTADYTTVANYFASYGLKVGGWPQRLALTVAGTRSQMENAIGTQFAFYKTTNGHTVLAPAGTVRFSKPLPISSIANAIVDPKATWTNAVRGQGTGNQELLSGNGPGQIATAFDYVSAYNAGYTGTGITIGIIGTGPAMNADFTQFKTQYAEGGAGTLQFPAVSAVAAANTFVPGTISNPQYPSGGSPTATPPAVTAPCAASSNPYYPPSESPVPGCNPEDFEAQIDTEQASLARDATIDFYLAYVPGECNDPTTNTCTPDTTTGLGYAYQGLAEVDDEIQQMIADNNVDVVSGSYAGPEILQGITYVASSIGGYDPSALLPSEMAALAAEGVAVFMSSGDDGAQSCAPYYPPYGADTCVSSPASDNNVTAVGGATTPLANNGSFIGPITGWGQQTWTGGVGGASGGGVSCYTPAPPWETQPTSYGTPWPALLESAGSSACGEGESVPGGGGRLLPDISLVGDPATGVAVIANTAFGGVTQNVFGGTSVAAPEMAAMWALVLDACRQTSSCDVSGGAKAYRLGNAAPLLWRNVYQKSAAAYDNTIYDITFGNNGEIPCVFQGTCPDPLPAPVTGYTAGTGWDAISGLGVPFARRLITAIVGV
jgi:subtilase family serine protease